MAEELKMEKKESVKAEPKTEKKPVPKREVKKAVESTYTYDEFVRSGLFSPVSLLKIAMNKAGKTKITIAEAKEMMKKFQ